MKPKVYYSALLAVGGISYGIAMALSRGRGSDNLHISAIAVIAFFAIFSTAMFHLATRKSRSANPYAFSQVFLGSVIIKIVLFIGLVFWTLQVMEIQAKDLVIPLAGIYVVFAIFETWFLMRIAKS